MAEAVRRGAENAGAEVLNLGLVGTVIFYFTGGKLGLDGGFMITASHNPKDYTGIKIVRAGALPVGGDSGLGEIREAAMSGARTRTQAKGSIPAYDVWPQY